MEGITKSEFLEKMNHLYPQCEANDINGCEEVGTFTLLDRHLRSCGSFCCEACANEYAGEVSEGTWCPFPEAHNALTPEQIDENLSYFRYDNQD